MKQRVFGSYRTLGPELVEQAGSAAEGFEAVFPYDPSRSDPRWIDFNGRFENRFHEPPEQFAALAYDAMNALLDSICKAGLNRARIHDALADIEELDGVTGHMVFDPNQKNVAPMYLGTVRNGAITYRLATMQKHSMARDSADAHESAAVTPYARIGDDGVSFNGPRSANPQTGPIRVVLFGVNAKEVAEEPEILTALRDGGRNGRRWTLLPVESGQNWGRASTQLVHAIVDEHAMAVIALDRDSSHLSEQIALKCFVPVMALSNDRTLTTANIPWIFRMPSGTAPVAAVRLLERAVARGGKDPIRLRDVLASGHSISGVTFLPAGELRSKE